MGDSKDMAGQCDTCTERKGNYQNQIRELHRKDSSNTANWSFWRNSMKSDNCASGEAKAIEECANKKEDDSKCDETCYKQPSGKPKPFPPPDVPALCLPAWFTCPPRITVPPYPAPAGVEIRPISEGGRNNKCQGGKCGKCGMERPPPGPPKVSPNCPMTKPKCANAKGEKGKGKDEGKGGGFLSKVASFFGMGGKEKK